jgi:hypothetical protein
MDSRTIASRSTIHLGELRARVAEQQVETVLRRLLEILVVTGSRSWPRSSR